MIQVIEEKTVINQELITVTDDSGNDVEVMSLYGSVELDRSVNYSFTILNKDIYNANKTELQAVVTAFVAALQDKITELGGCTF